MNLRCRTGEGLTLVIWRAAQAESDNQGKGSLLGEAHIHALASAALRLPWFKSAQGFRGSLVSLSISHCAAHVLTLSSPRSPVHSEQAPVFCRQTV